MVHCTCLWPASAREKLGELQRNLHPVHNPLSNRHLWPRGACTIVCVAPTPRAWHSPGGAMWHRQPEGHPSRGRLGYTSGFVGWLFPGRGTLRRDEATQA
jgi:hypothetical protein